MIQGKRMGITYFERDFNPVSERPQHIYLPTEILDNPSIVWLGSDSNDTIPTFARDLRNKIIFIDTMIDCNEYIIALSASQHSIILVMSDEYSVYRKEIENMLKLFEIKMIYVIINGFKSNDNISFLRNQRLKYIFNDTSSVLKQLCIDRDQRLVSLALSMAPNKKSAKINSTNVING